MKKIFEKLLSNINLNNLSNVKANKFALSSFIGQKNFIHPLQQVLTRVLDHLLKIMILRNVELNM